MNTVFNIGLHHFLFVSIILVGAGVATMLTKRNAIGILIGVELVINAAAINFVAFNRYSHGEQVVPHVLTVQQLEAYEQLQLASEADDAQGNAEAMLLKVVRKDNPDAVAVTIPETRQTIATQAVSQDAAGSQALAGQPLALTLRVRAIDGLMFAIFIVVLAAAEAAVALAIFLNYYNNFSSIDVEKGAELKG